jgi:hypothetical protein
MKRGQTQFKTMLHKIIYNDLTHQLHILIDFVIDYTRKNLTSCSKSANKPSTSCVRTACPKLSTSMEQVVNSCNNLAGIIRLVVRLFQQVRYSHDITILLQPCVVNLLTFLLYHDCIRLVRTTLCNKSDNAINLVTSC